MMETHFSSELITRLLYQSRQSLSSQIIVEEVIIFCEFYDFYSRDAFVIFKILTLKTLG